MLDSAGNISVGEQGSERAYSLFGVPFTGLWDLCDIGGHEASV